MKEKILHTLSRIYPFHSINKLAYYKRVLESFYISRQLNSCGKGTRFGKVEYTNGLTNVSIGTNTVFLPHLYITTWGDGKINIGDNCSFGSYCHISAFNSIIIGNNLLTGKWVSIVDNNHGLTDRVALSTPPFPESYIPKVQ